MESLYVEKHNITRMTTVYIQSEKIVEEEIAAEEENIKDP
jgi:hypothetical protein